MKKLLAIALIASTIVLSACNKDAKSPLIERGTPAEKQTLNTYDLKKENPSIFFEKTATIKAQTNSTVSSEIAGRITKVNVENGQTVKKGDILVTLGDSLSTDIQEKQAQAANEGLYLSYETRYLTNQLGENTMESIEIALDTAKDNLKQAKKAYSKAESLYDGTNEAQKEQLKQLKQGEEMARKQYQSAIIQQDQAQISREMQLIQAQNQLNQAQLNQEIANMSTEKKYVRAPINGVITSINAEEGNITGPGQPLAQIATTGEQIIKVGLNSEEFGYIQVGDSVTVKSSTSTTKGTIKTATTTLDPITQKHLVEISVNKNAITTGDIISVAFKVNTEKLFIPLNNVLLEDGEKTVKILKNDQAEKVNVETGTIFSNYIEIISGLSGTEKLVVSYDNN